MFEKLNNLVHHSPNKRVINMVLGNIHQQINQVTQTLKILPDQNLIISPKAAEENPRKQINQQDL